MNSDHSMRASVPIRKVANAQVQELQDDIVVEAPLEIRIAHPLKDAGATQQVAITMRTPGQDIELGIGFLFTEGIIQSYAEVEATELSDEGILTVHLTKAAKRDWAGLDRKIYTSSSCGICGKADMNSIKQETPYLPWSSSLRIEAATIQGLPEKIMDAQSLFVQTGGAHATALFTAEGEMLLLREDVGRHNAMDKLIGAALQQDMLPLSQHHILVSGRSSFELVQKAAMAGVPILSAVGAPSSLAVATAEEHGMTLIGFLKKDRFNVYCGERVKV